MNSTATPLSSDQRRRLTRLLAAAGALILAGLAYAAFARATGLMIPCPFRTVTGLLCPGCGVSHLCLALLRLDVAGAWQANPGLFVLLPPLGVLAAYLAAVYVKTGRPAPGRRASVAAWAMAAWLLAWGVVRNLI